MNRNNNWLIAVIVVLAIFVLACCMLAVVAAAVGWVADDVSYGPMMDDYWGEGDCPGCPGRGPVGMRTWLGPALFVVLGLTLLVVLAAVVVAAVVWAGRSNRPTVDVTTDVPEVPDIEE